MPGLELNLTHIKSPTFLLSSFFTIFAVVLFLWPSKTFADNPPPICYSFDNDLEGWVADDLAGAISWLPSKMHLEAADHPHPGNTDYYVLPIFPDDIPNVYKITFSYNMSTPEILFRLSDNSDSPTIVLCQREDIGFSGSIECNFSPSIAVDGADPSSGVETTIFFDSYGTSTDWSGDLDNICVYSSTIGPPQTLYLPFISKGPDIYPFGENPATFDLTP
jgi:hypothetical protein